jgi:hypothetical protein
MLPCALRCNATLQAAGRGKAISELLAQCKGLFWLYGQSEVEVMARYNWEELKQKFLLGDYKSLRKFAECEGLNYKSSYFFKRTKGWIEEKEAREKEKRSEIIERVIEKQIEQEVDWNTAHLNAWGELLNIVNEILKARDAQLSKNGKINVYALEKIANILEKIQKGQNKRYSKKECNTDY